MFSMSGIVLADELRDDVHLLGTRRREFLHPDRPLVRAKQRGRGGQKGIPHQPDRRLRIHDRHSDAVEGDGQRATSAGSNAHSPQSPPDAGIPDCGGAAASFAGRSGRARKSRFTCGCPMPWKVPTPVSALIHAATMVAAGVYMMVRVSFLLELPGAETAGTVIAWIGGHDRDFCRADAPRSRTTSSASWPTPRFRNSVT